MEHGIVHLRGCGNIFAFMRIVCCTVHMERILCIHRVLANGNEEIMI